MTGYLRRRLFQLIPTLVGTVTLVFFMIRLLPGDPLAYIAGENVTPAAYAQLQQNLGFDKPLPVQYADYVSGALRGDLGLSILTRNPVTRIIVNALPYTLLLAILGLTTGVVVAVPLGVLAAVRRGSWVDQGVSLTSLVLDVLPSFWLALLLMLLFTLRLGWFPSTGLPRLDDPLALSRRLVLPTLVLAVGLIASLSRITRASVLEVLGDDYIRTARALGTPEVVVLFKHALKNACLPLVTVAGLAFGNLLAGTVIVETVFALPGMGTVLINSIQSRDYPVVQGVILLYTLIFVLVNLLTDVLYTWVDPRIRL
jgi:ABC-type dipeptide/oligopeptide/nickel transport system permease component